MEWNRLDGRTILVALIIAVVAVAGCEGGQDGDTRPADLPDAALDALSEPGTVGTDLLPRSGELSGFAISYMGDFAVTAEVDPDASGSSIGLLSWNEDEGRWSDPAPFEFTDAESGDGGPTLAPDGSYLLFHSARSSGNPAASDMNIWVAQRGDDEGGEVSWSDPWLVPGVFSPAWDGTPALAGSGDLYFASMRDGPENGRDLFVAPFEQGTWMAPQKLPGPLNSSADELDPYVGPDAEFVLFSSDRDGDFDVFVVFAQGEGWGEPRPLNETVNSEGADERTPYLSSGGSTLFWLCDGELMAAPVDETGLAEAQQEAGGSTEAGPAG